VLGEEISPHEFVQVVEPVGNGSKILPEIGPFNPTVGVKDIHDEASTNPMDDVKVVLPGNTNRIYEKGENPQAPRVSQYRYSV
jgi:hypothetical protein